MESVTVTAAKHEPPCKVVDNDNFVVFNNVIAIPLKETLGLEGLVKIVGQVFVLIIIEVVNPHDPLHLLDARLCRYHRFGLLIDGIVFLFLQHPDDLGEAVIEVC